TLTLNPQTICEASGTVDLRTLVDAAPPGGVFAFSGHAAISGTNFDPTGLAGSTVSIFVDYSTGACVAPQGTFDLAITSNAVTTVPAAAVLVCESSGAVDLLTHVSAVPAGGVFAFSGAQVTG